MAVTAWLLGRVLGPLVRLVGQGWQTSLGLRDEIRVRLGAARGLDRLGEYLTKQAAFDAHCREQRHKSRRQGDTL